MLYRACFVSTIGMPVRVFLTVHFQKLAAFMKLDLACGGKIEEIGPIARSLVAFFPVAIERQIALGRDLLSLARLFVFFARKKYDVVHSVMPKAGLIAMTAAALAGVPCRFHWFTGQVWVTRRGIARYVLKAADTTTALFATEVLADSHSQREFLADQRILARSKVTVLGSGSIAGVDTRRFKADPEIRSEIRQDLKLGEDAVVGLFLGRITKDKGIVELLNAHRAVTAKHPEFVLLLVGPTEETRSPSPLNLGRNLGGARLVGETSTPERYYAAADFLILPSYREGFGSSVIEAAACGIPSIGTRIYGLTDAILDGQTGLLVPVRDPSALARAMTTLIEQPEQRSRLGRAAKARVEREFTSAELSERLAAFYRRQFAHLEGVVV